MVEEGSNLPVASVAASAVALFDSGFRLVDDLTASAGYPDLIVTSSPQSFTLRTSSVASPVVILAEVLLSSTTATFPFSVP